jgi:putative ABC transport system ATP-binding protein
MILSVKNLSKTFHQAHSSIEVLKNLNLQIQSGETVAILGKSGSGKSTLLSLLAGLDHSGSIELMGTSLFQLKEKELTHFRARHMGIIFQHFHLIPHLTSFENVALPLEILNVPEINERASELLHQVGLVHRANHLPSKLSGGEKQRVAIARALATNPPLLLADEPSGSLDEETGLQVMNLVFDLVKNQQKALVLVTHDQELAARCSHRFLLENGQLKKVN